MDLVPQIKVLVHREGEVLDEAASAAVEGQAEAQTEVSAEVPEQSEA